MMLDFNDDRTYTKDVVLANVRYALLDPNAVRHIKTPVTQLKS